MLSWLLGSKCAVCNKKAKESRNYFNDKGKPIVVCLKCIPYAERRAYRKR
jgi:hypothetical protein